MTRLTNEVRHQVMTRLLERSFSKRFEALETEEHALAHEVYNDIYPPEIQAQMQALPAGFLPVETSIYCRFGRDYHVLDFGGMAGKRMADKHAGIVAKGYPASSHLTMKYIKFASKRNALRDERNQAEATAREILYGVSTVEKLLKTWPECKPFVESVTPVPKPLPPALPIPEINAMLGLTAAQEAQEQPQ